ncbi:Slx4p interacting protein [Pichia californica]|uniref:Slx4p interacting protein n=1 Tax=Pichia californica TaxID=460514 RepID=A0A9P7BE62_9ASCO|nr:Slx4p interacting protein [[Candida] californica]
MIENIALNQENTEKSTTTTTTTTTTAAAQSTQVSQAVESQYISQSQFESELETDFESQSQSQLTDGKKKHKIPPLYGVYLLNSLSKKSCFYVGSTPDPHRRLRQHNGELTRGGAYRTKKKGYRPWRMILYVYGFPNKISALQFEHAWQHSYQTRHIPFIQRLNPGKKQTGSGTSIHSKIANCRLLLNSKSFNRLGLKIAIFNNLAYETWMKNRFGIMSNQDIHLNVKISTEELDECIIMGGNYNQLKEFMQSIITIQDEYIQKCKDIFNNGDSKKCKICDKETCVEDGLNTLCVCTHGECKCTYHLGCLSKKFLKEENDKEGQEKEKEILPKKGKCVECEKIIFWNAIVRGAVSLQQEYGVI